ncbi:glucokinase [Geomonas nitrogeniifigens]|uniref:Glucokinase n=1 Tax=Geomonas diazotrophica TaxID=2843197 RepID=A0ABX8JLQ8_9BACT|nr:glucokinase [Geomonas nitrogeniifigens]QWV99243.1 glucokinase [Geomonas nitrogeniifigens]QXE88412.1 glucokinase [Geomonas nitrogeniifigens]
MLILAGDVGGTTTRLAYFEADSAGLTVLAHGQYKSAAHGSLAEMLRQFALQHGIAAERACLGIAGPVIEGRVRTPNLPWTIEDAELALALGIPQVRLINDLEANTYGIAALKQEDLFTLNAGTPNPEGTIAVVSAGTGLGESLAYWDGDTHRPLPSEAGHADFAARSDLETELLLYLQAKHGRVSYERVLSGPGLYDIYRFLRDKRYFNEDPAVAQAMGTQDTPAVITRAALKGSCPMCAKAVDLFIGVYGAEAGNAALRFLSTGGVYLGGGIAPKILDLLKGATFMVAFTAKGRLSALVQSIPVHVILNEDTALLGAGRAAFYAR